MHRDQSQTMVNTENHRKIKDVKVKTNSALCNEHYLVVIEISLVKYEKKEETGKVVN